MNHAFTSGFASVKIISKWEVHVDNYKYEDELEFFIQLLNKTALQEIGVRDTVTIENTLLDSPTEEEVANDVVRVDVSHSQ